MAAFTAKSFTQNTASPFTPPHHRSKSGGGQYNSRHADSNIVLSTLGSIHHDSTADHDLGEIDDVPEGMHLPLSMELGSLSTAIGGDDGEPIPDDCSQAPSQATSRFPIPMPPIPAYRALELGFRPSKTPSVSDVVRGIRVDVEKATATM